MKKESDLVCQACYPHPWHKGACEFCDCGSPPAATRKMPRQKPGLSKQDYGTPPEFLQAVKKKFGFKEFAYDLAADKMNRKAKLFFDERDDSLSKDWKKLRGHLWLNPPFANIEPWVRKCSESRQGNHVIYFLVPASVGANWFAEWVARPIERAEMGVNVLFLQGRLSFDGKAPYPKDCMLIRFSGRSYLRESGYEVWNWRKEEG